jgi:hypothetical protein
MFSLSVLSIDRLGRDLRDIINTIHFFSENKITIHFVSQGLATLDIDGKENPIAKMIISILGVVGEMERTQIKERQVEGIKIAKLKGIYKGRVEGSKESVDIFLGKEKNKKSLELLKRGYKVIEISKISGVHINTITNFHGKYKNIPKNTTLRIYVVNESQSSCWINTHNVNLNSSDKTWELKVYVGGIKSTGNKIYIVVALEDDITEQWREYYKTVSKELNDWRPLKFPLPSNIVETKKILVERI